MDPFERAAYREIVEARRLGFRIHLWVYVAVQVLLVVTWWLTSNNGEVMPWFLFPLIGWGIGLAAHYVAIRGGRDRRREQQSGDRTSGQNRDGRDHGLGP